MLKKAVQQGRRRVETGGVPLGHVEDFEEPRTLLAGFFSILLEGYALRTAITSSTWLVTLTLRKIAFNLPA